MKSTKAPIGSIQSVNQGNQRVPVPYQSVASSNTPNFMGKTVLNTVYPIQSQIPNQNPNVNMNSQVNSQILQNTVVSRMSNAPNRLDPSQMQKNGSNAQQSGLVGQSKFTKTIIKDGKQITNIDLNDEADENVGQSLTKKNLTLLNNPTIQSVHVSNQQSKMGSTLQSQNPNLPTLSQQIKSSAGRSVNPNVYPQQQSIHNTAIPQKQSIHNTSIPQKPSIHNTAIPQKPSVYNTAIPQKPSIHNTAIPQKQSIHNTAIPQKQSIYNTAIPQKQSIQNPNLNLQSQKQSINNPSVYQSSHPQNPSVYSQNMSQFPQNQSVHPQNMSQFPQNQSVHSQNMSQFPQNQSVHSQNISQFPQNPSVHSNANQNLPSQSHQSKQQSIVQQSHQSHLNQTNVSGKESQNLNINSQMNRKSVNEPNKSTQSKLKRKSTLKASRNKSPPQVIRTADGKIKRTNSDTSGNSYYVTTDEEAIVSDSYICSHLDDYLNKEIVNKISKDTKPENAVKGNGYRYYGQLTKAGRNQNGKTKINQDTPLVHLNVGDVKGFNLFGVLDGHGSQGHFVSQFCRDYFIRVMNKYAESCKKSKLTTPEAIYNELKRTKFAYIIDAFNKADIHMEQQKFDYKFSGTTCNIVFQFNKHLVCASVGDSRGILIYDKGDKKNEGIFPLSTDHKPDLPGEIDRIKSHGGVVEQIVDNEGNKVGPQRVWKAGLNYPGLAMSRSLGDFEAKEAGVISTPQITEYTISHLSKYMIICSDGVWEFIQNEQVRDLGNAFIIKNDVGGFCTELVKFAMHSWEQFDIIRDDITVVCVYF